MILLSEEYSEARLNLELELCDLNLYCNINKNMFLLSENENIFKRIVNGIKTVITKIINFIRGAFKKAVKTVQKEVSELNKTINKVDEKQTEINVDSSLNGAYTLIDKKYIEKVSNSFLYKTDFYDRMKNYLEYFKDSYENENYILNEVRSFCVNFKMYGFSFIYPNLQIKELIENSKDLKKYIKEDINKNSYEIDIIDGKMKSDDYNQIVEEFSFFENSLNEVLKDADQSEKNLKEYRSILDELGFISSENVFKIFKYFSDLVIEIIKGNMNLCEIINAEIKLKINFMKKIMKNK